MDLQCIEICAGAGGQAFGLHQSGFSHLALVEQDPHCVATLLSVPEWADSVMQEDVRSPGLPEALSAVVRSAGSEDLDLLAGGVPCPPFSRAGHQHGADDERDLFPTAIRLVETLRPRAVLFENVRGFLDPKFAQYRREVIEEPLSALGYEVRIGLANAARFGVPQARLRTVIVAIRCDRRQIDEVLFDMPGAPPWPAGSDAVMTVGNALRDEMARGGWVGADEWARRADGVAPALVGGSKKHGGPDLGPTQARARWEQLGVNGKLVKVDPPGPGHTGMPYLSVRMAAIVQGFPAHWPFQGAKTHAYRQVGNAFPPPVARAFGEYVQALLRLAGPLGDGRPSGSVPSHVG